MKGSALQDHCSLTKYDSGILPSHLKVFVKNKYLKNKS